MTPQSISDVQFLWIYIVGFCMGVFTTTAFVAGLLIASRRKK